MKTLTNTYNKENVTVHINRGVYKDFVRMVVEKHGQLHGHVQVEVEAAFRAYIAAQKAAGVAENVNGGD